jgi:hypothetical protein
MTKQEHCIVGDYFDLADKLDELRRTHPEDAEAISMMERSLDKLAGECRKELSEEAIQATTARLWSDFKESLRNPFPKHQHQPQQQNA